MLQELGKFTSAIVASHRAISCWLLGEFCKGGDPEEYGEFVPMVAKDLINRLHDEDETTVVNAFTAMDQVCVRPFVVLAQTPTDACCVVLFLWGSWLSPSPRRTWLNTWISFVACCGLLFLTPVTVVGLCNTVLISFCEVSEGELAACVLLSLVYIHSLCSLISRVTGFVTPAGLAAFVPVFQYGLMNGSEDTRETAALALGELAQHSAPEALKAHLVKITGPLIRIVGDKFPSKVNTVRKLVVCSIGVNVCLVFQVKAAILSTLGIIIDKGGVALRAFLPQLQPTFVKSLSDPNKVWFFSYNILLRFASYKCVVNVCCHPGCAHTCGGLSWQNHGVQPTCGPDCERFVQGY